MGNLQQLSEGAQLEMSRYIARPALERPPGYIGEIEYIGEIGEIKLINKLIKLINDFPYFPHIYFSISYFLYV